MYSNQLSGELPGTNFATKLTKLTDLVLNNNLLTGPLPSSFGSFASVKSMYARAPVWASVLSRACYVPPPPRV